LIRPWSCLPLKKLKLISKLYDIEMIVIELGLLIFRKVSLIRSMQRLATHFTDSTDTNWAFF